MQTGLEDSHKSARRHLRFLLMGNDPHTGEKLSAECIVMDVDVNRSLSIALEALELCDRRRASSAQYMAKRKPLTARFSKKQEPSADLKQIGAAWTSKEDGRLLAEFRQNCNLLALAALHQRTRGAIIARLVHLKVAVSREEARRVMNLRH